MMNILLNIILVAGRVKPGFRFLYFVLQKYRIARDTFKGIEINNSSVLWNRDFNDVPLLYYIH